MLILKVLDDVSIDKDRPPSPDWDSPCVAPNIYQQRGEKAPYSF